MADGSATQAAVYCARPTLRFNGEADERAANLIDSLSIREAEGGLRALELVLGDTVSTRTGTEPAFGEDSAIRFGAQIEVYLGEVDRPCEVFRGRITAIESQWALGRPPLLRVRAEDALLAARLARRSKVYTDVSPADLVRAVAGDLGLTPVLTALDAPIATWAQVDETDLAFLRRVLARFDADLQIVGVELHVSARADVQRGRIDLAYGRDLQAISIGADLAHQVTSVQARGWDAVAGSVVKAEVAAVTHAGPGRGRDGATVQRDAYGARADNLGHLAVATQDEAQALAEAAFDRRARRFVCARGVTEGNPNLRVGSCVALGGVGPRFDNEYYVVSTHHRYDLAQGYRTEFVAECAFLGGSA